MYMLYIHANIYIDMCACINILCSMCNICIMYMYTINIVDRHTLFYFMYATGFCFCFFLEMEGKTFHQQHPLYYCGLEPNLRDL